MEPEETKQYKASSEEWVCFSLGLSVSPKLQVVTEDKKAGIRQAISWKHNYITDRWGATRLTWGGRNDLRVFSWCVSGWQNLNNSKDQAGNKSWRPLEKTCCCWWWWWWWWGGNSSEKLTWDLLSWQLERLNGWWGRCWNKIILFLVPVWGNRVVGSRGSIVPPYGPIERIVSIILWSQDWLNFKNKKLHFNSGGKS